MHNKNTLLTVSDLLFAVHGSIFGHTDCLNGEMDCKYSFFSVTTDSQTVCANSLFVPLVGETQDGHRYVEQAVQKGASIIFVQESSLAEYRAVYESLSTHVSLCIIIVKNTLYALQNAAAAYIQKFPALKKIAITGSSGKTTTKECVVAVLSERYAVIMNEGNRNSETGLPLSAFTIRNKHEIAVFEMGMNHRGEIKELSDVFFPQIALITNIGTAHIGILGTQNAIAEEKKQIFANFNSNCIGFLPEDEIYRDFLVKDVPGTMNTYGLETTTGIEGVKNMGISGSDILYKGEVIHFPLSGSYNVQNALAAICLGQEFNLSAVEIKKGLEAVRPLFGRSQILKGSPTIIQDCYNANYESMSVALDFIFSLEWSAKKILVLGDMLELGASSDRMHDDIVKLAFASDAAALFFIGEAFSAAVQRVGNYGEKKVFFTKTIDDKTLTQMITTEKKLFAAEDLVLLKGSRGIQLERVVPLIQKIVHMTQEVSE